MVFVPIWIDIEGETKPIPFAVDEMKKLISGFQKSQTVLVYDVFLEDAYKANFQEAWQIQKLFWHGNSLLDVKVMQWFTSVMVVQVGKKRKYYLTLGESRKERWLQSDLVNTS